MYRKCFDNFQKIFTNCRRTLGKETWGRVLAALDEDSEPQVFHDILLSLKNAFDLPDFIVDLARLEWALYRAKEDKTSVHQPYETVIVNPTLTLVPVSWKNLVTLINGDIRRDFMLSESSQIQVMIWRHSKTDDLHIREADDIDLLALKIIIEQVDPREAATIGGVNVGAIHTALNRAIAQGILISPGSRIQRASLSSLQTSDAFEHFITADIFTLQWHITQACDLHCKHCYDRRDRASMSYDTGIAVLDDFYGFCRQMHVRGQVTFTGGNPMLYPRFIDIYQAASDFGFGLAILGNPTPIEKIERLLDIAKPLYFQISLEGLAEYNDYIRGDGHFQRSLDFLDQLKQLDIFTMVMLTLNRDNLDQVLPLGSLLKDRADFFTFNRLSTVGEGAQLMMPQKENFEAFIRKYEEMAGESPLLGLKDNLINIIRKEKGIEPFGGCTGYGCGAAFNFVALLPDGEVHACRKFPSPIGNILQTRLIDIYHSNLAHKYRTGSEACLDCSLAVVCRGCLAITYSNGLEVFKDRDPFCFVSEEIYGKR
ncbi:MAG: thio(seleno)oxazole modification radical SAM maturase SbtM [Desulfobacterales bacterium]|nr:thio(seleno)oxazole modification radical SAM maturase SbtM [Desulfobacterales bacterium]